jgi:hypothetical protein
MSGKVSKRVDRLGPLSAARRAETVRGILGCPILSEIDGSWLSPSSGYTDEGRNPNSAGAVPGLT